MSKKDHPKVKWLDLTPKQLRNLASAMDDHAHDMGIDREQLLEEQGFDVVAGSARPKAPKGSHASR